MVLVGRSVVRVMIELLRPLMEAENLLPECKVPLIQISSPFKTSKIHDRSLILGCVSARVIW